MRTYKIVVHLKIIHAEISISITQVLRPAPYTFVGAQNHYYALCRHPSCKHVIHAINHRQTDRQTESHRQTKLLLQHIIVNYAAIHYITVITSEFILSYYYYYLHALLATRAPSL